MNAVTFAVTAFDCAFTVMVFVDIAALTVDTFEILSRIELEEETLDSLDNGIKKTDTRQGFAERRSRQ